MLLADRFNKSSEPSESLVVNGDDPSCATLEGEEASILNMSATALTKVILSSEL